MSNKAKKEYLAAIKSRYKIATKKEKANILDEFCKVCEYNRKYAIRLLNSNDRPKMSHKRSGRKKKYHQNSICRFIKHLWISTNQICSTRLKAAIPLWLPYYPYALTETEKQLIFAISPSTIDRLLKKTRRKYKKLGLSTTKPGSLLKKQVKIKTNQWNEFQPGFVEADTVAHCGSSVAGQFIYSVQLVDIAAGRSDSQESCSNI